MRERATDPLCPQLRSFCCFFSIKSGANIVGWFNFVANALYIGACVKSLASVRDALDVYNEQLNLDYVEHILPWMHFNRNLESGLQSGCAKHKNTFTQMTATEFLDKNEWREFLLKHQDVLRECPITEMNLTMAEALDYIENTMMPQFYWSTLVPFVVLIFSIAWLTLVESNVTFRLVKASAYSFIAAIIMQIVIQFALISHFHGRFKFLLQKREWKSNNVKLKPGDGIHWSVWFIFIVYTCFNIYAIPVIVTYVNQVAKSVLDERMLSDSGKSSGDSPEFSVTYDRSAVRNRSFRIEDDPMGDNFRQSLEDIRVGFRTEPPKTPALSRVTSLTDEPIKEEVEPEQD